MHQYQISDKCKEYLHYTAITITALPFTKGTKCSNRQQSIRHTIQCIRLHQGHQTLPSPPTAIQIIICSQYIPDVDWHCFCSNICYIDEEYVCVSVRLPLHLVHGALFVRYVQVTSGRPSTAWVILTDWKKPLNKLWTLFNATFALEEVNKCLIKTAM